MSKDIQAVLQEALEAAYKNKDGKIANYIPELATADPEKTQIALVTTQGERYSAGNALEESMTLQSTAKLVVLIAMLEEFGFDQVQSWVRSEPSGDDFASVARLDQFGPKPSNPMLNAGSITLCGHIPGDLEEQLAWLEKWMTTLFNTKVSVDQKTFASERRTGDRNRSLAYLLKSNGVIQGNVEEILEAYFFLCSFQTTVEHAAHLPMLLANRGYSATGESIISERTVEITLAIMATCGLYNESGTHLVRSGLPAKSGVSGLILASAIGRAGIAVMSPRVNRKGNSLRGLVMLEHLSATLGWHFANLK